MRSDEVRSGEVWCGKAVEVGCGEFWLGTV